MPYDIAWRPPTAGRVARADPAQGTIGFVAVERGEGAVVTPRAADLLERLVQRFGPRRDHLVERRRDRALAVQRGERLDFTVDPDGVRSRSWTVSGLPFHRPIELVGPPTPDHLVPGMNGGADRFVADFEDALVPRPDTVLAGHRAVAEAVRRTLAYDAPAGRRFRLARRTAALAVRPRDLAAADAIVLDEGPPIPAALFDVGLHLARDAEEMVARGGRPYLYLGSIETGEEAEFWSDAIAWIEDELGLPLGLAGAGAVVGAVPATFQMDEILYALRERSPALVLAPVRYLAGVSRLFREDPRFALPDRATLGIETPLLEAIARLLVATARRRGAPALCDVDRPATMVDRGSTVGWDGIAELERIALDGFDGAWVRDVPSIDRARTAFRGGPLAPAIDGVGGPTVPVPVGLLRPPDGSITFDGVRASCRTVVRYLESWLRGVGFVDDGDGSRDRAEADLARSLLWQWVHQGVQLDDGSPISSGLVRELLGEEEALWLVAVGVDPERTWATRQAARLADELVTGWDPPEALPSAVESRRTPRERPWEPVTA